MYDQLTNTMKKILFLLIVLFTLQISAQLKGTVSDAKGNPLPFVNVYLDKTVTGTTTNNAGEYELALQTKGDHTVVFQFLGFKTLKKTITVDAFPFVLDVALEEQEIQLNEVRINTTENPANGIIRNVIANKEKNTDKLGAYTANFYSRGMFKVLNAPEKILGQKLGDLGGGLDSTRTGIIYLSETVSEISYQKTPKNFKEYILASKVSGENNGISFNRAEEANFNFYDNLVRVTNNDLVSPISDAAFRYYSFDLEGSFYTQENKLISKIKVTPKNSTDRAFSGFIYIAEDQWALYGVDLTATGKQVGIPIIDFIHFKQDYNFSENNNAWVLISQAVDFKFGFFGFNVDGRFTAAYANYNFTPNFGGNTFSKEVLRFAEEATKKDSVFWEKLRPVPLTREEQKDYIVKERIREERNSKPYLDSVDATNNRFKLAAPLLGYRYANSFEKWSINYTAPLSSLAFNTVQGWNMSTGLSYFKRLNDTGKWFQLGTRISYGVSDHTIRPVLYYSKKWNNTNRPRLNISLGNQVLQFNNANPISTFSNTYHTLVRKKNYMKLYEQWFANVNYNEEISNGIRLNVGLSYLDRRPLFNTTDFTFYPKDYPSKTNNPLDYTDTSAPFDAHKIGSLTLGTSIVFGQKYLSYPNSKINIGNTRYPSVYLGYRKNFGAQNANLNSDLLVTRIRQEIALGNSGDFEYHIKSGIFLKKKDIAFMDYIHPNGNQVQIVSQPFMNSFGLLDYYQFATNDKQAEVHLSHQFKGSFLRKIPLIKQLDYHLVVGAKRLFSDKVPYSEFSVGLDNLGFGKWRFLRVDYVQSQYHGNSRNGLLFSIRMFD